MRTEERGWQQDQSEKPLRRPGRSGTMKLIEIAERTWTLDREEIIKRKCPTDLGERYRKYENAQKPECDQPGACEYC